METWKPTEPTTLIRLVITDKNGTQPTEVHIGDPLLLQITGPGNDCKQMQTAKKIAYQNENNTASEVLFWINFHKERPNAKFGKSSLIVDRRVR